MEFYEIRFRQGVFEDRSIMSTGENHSMKCLDI
jgi:hypothetical protein